MLRGLLLVLVLLGSGAGVHAQVTSPQWALKQIFGKNAAVLQLQEEAVAEVCPDETCFRFVLPSPNGIETVHDFAYLYFWLVEGYDLAPNKAANGERFVVTILNRRKAQCTGADEEAIGRCVLARMATTPGLSGFVTRMDNGWRQRFPINIQAILPRADGR